MLVHCCSSDTGGFPETKTALFHITKCWKQKCPSILTNNKRNLMQADLIVSTHQHLLQVAPLEVVLSGWGSLLNNERGRLPHTSLTADQG